MNNELKIKMYSFTIDCKEPNDLAKFYANLMDWEIVYSDDNWAVVGAPGTKQGQYPGILFQKNLEYVKPVWPAKKDYQQQMAHLDFGVNDLDLSIKHALECGATIARDQFDSNQKVMLDPEGHPFCLCLMTELINTDDFSLR